jgi:hypothetical protein
MLQTPHCVRLLAAALLASSPLACTRVTPPPVAAVRPPDPPPLAVTYRIQRSVDGEGLLLAGRMDIGIHDDGRVEAVSSHNSAAHELALTVRPEDDGSLVARARYEERGPDGTTIKWAPAMRVARGAPAHAEVAGNGWARTIDLLVQ